MDKMKMQSMNLTDCNIEKIGALFPNCITEDVDEKGNLKKAINFDILKQMLSSDIAEGNESYEFSWVGKKASIVEANKPIRKTLRPCVEESVNWDTTENLYIEGDNLEVLKLLQESYLGKVKMIYIDPPYNTGNDFIYNDDFKMSGEEYSDQIGEFDDDGNRMFKNTDSNGRFHSDWCSMIYPRLMLARNLLSDDGVIFISIDDNEVDNLKKMCDEVFGADNFVNIISIKLKNIAGASGGGEDKRLKKNMEYVLVYAKSYIKLNSFKNVYNYIPVYKLVEQYRNEGISWKYTSALVNQGDKVYVGSTVDGDGLEIKIYKRINFEIKSIGKIIHDENISEEEAYKKYASCLFQTAMPQSSIRPRVLKKVFELGGIESELYSIEYIPKTGRNKGKLYEQFYKGNNFRLLAWLKDVTEEIDGILYKKDMQGTFWNLVSEINNLTKEGNIAFPNGKKPLKLLNQMLLMATNDNDIILDFFSGSATTAHAVIAQNFQDVYDGKLGKRKFIMVQLPEPTDEKSEAYKAGYKNICEIGKERIRRAGQQEYMSVCGTAGSSLRWDTTKRGVDKDYPCPESVDIGFRVLKLDDTNMNDVYYSPLEINQEMLIDQVENIKPDRTDLDLLFGCLIDWGVELSMPYSSEIIEGCTVHNYNDGDLIACFDKNIPESVIKNIAKRQPLRAVFRDSCFKDSPSKINVEEIFKMIAPDTRVKVI